MYLDIITPNQFDQFVQTVNEASFEQTSQMMGLLTDRGYQTYALALFDQNHQIQVAAILFGQAVAGGLRMEIHYGPIYNDRSFLKDFLIELKDFAKKQAVIELEIKPYDTYQRFNDQGQATSEEDLELLDIFQAAGFQYGGLTSGFETSDWHYIKDLSGLTPTNLLKSFSKKGRPLVKKAHTFGITLRALQREELAIFQDIVDRTSDRRGYAAKNLEYYQFFYDRFAENCEFMVASLNFSNYLSNLKADQEKLAKQIQNLQDDLVINPNSTKKQNQLRELSSQFETFTVRQTEAQELIEQYGQEDVILAGSLFVYKPQESVYLFSGSYTEFNKFYAPALLQEYVMLESLKRGITRYNLLGFSGDFSGKDGILRFKQNFNGHVERKPGSFYYYPKPLKYKAIQFMKKVLNR
ncbi:aminoacyltransferase [Streptococcus cuniculipharyngis]|uniref:Aminoacyltransferase FemA n=1 Tax=Streptococcus cuniculipharyngis TaxID=1562651 RepID=A0A5C5SE51_9STRE|nr:aminoacyltransferase [Streptococcus cuniculipharyngis]TWS99059.1 aminoacyltransferase [Streptococcus cuniculipharyngis]